MGLSSPDRVVDLELEEEKENEREIKIHSKDIPENMLNLKKDDYSHFWLDL